MPDALTAVRLEAQKQVDFHEAWADMLAQVETVENEIAAGNKNVQRGFWLAANDAFTRAGAAVSHLDQLDAPLVAHLPAGFDVVKKGAEVARLRASIAVPVASETKRIEREEAARAAKEQRAAAKQKAQDDKDANYAALCGEQPLLGGWGGGEVIGLKRWLRESAHDPDSISVDKCTRPMLSQGSCWLVTCNVRGKSGLGALMLQRKTFAYSKALGFQEVQ